MPVNWTSQAEIIKDGAVFAKFIHALLGLYIWEWFTSLEFDYAHLSGQKPFRWPMIFYFLNRYCLLFALIGISIALNVTTEINCQALYTFNQCLGNASVGLASINLSLRTMAVWNQKLYIVIPLVLLIMGHWSLLLHGILLNAAWEPTQQTCVITSTNTKILAVSFIYSMSLDFIVLSLTAFKLYFPSTGRSRLVTLIFKDGIIYFIVAFLANLLATIFMVMDLNAVMSIIANVPAAIASTIVACRCVRRLSTYSVQGPEQFSTSRGSGLAFRSFGRPKITTAVPTSVHVQMETFQQSPAESDVTAYSPNGQGPNLKDDKIDNDMEAQNISTDFKRPPY